MSTSDRFLLAGVMGWPVMHSRSPMLHNYLFAQHGLAGTYVPLAIKPEQSRGALRGLAPLGFAGCNITIPHKAAGAGDRGRGRSDVARRIGAISCVIVRPDGSLAGTNNDCFGFIAEHAAAAAGVARRCRARSSSSAPAAARGRSSTPGASAARARFASSTARSRARKTLAREFGPPVAAFAWEERHLALEGAALLVNTTSQGMVGQPPLDLSLDTLPAARARLRHRLRAA